MSLDPAFVGEDVPIIAEFDGGTTDPDDTGTDGTGDAMITITDNSDGTELQSSVAMTHQSTGTFEYVWDTSTANGAGSYGIEVSAEFGGETKIVQSHIRLR
ncbi:hypothetical protein [Natrinema soli]|uniref:FlgD Ig-like domain-containing protein n=1 Tax=Natrinema soli TaxID=1930624 RepID=A0ABD5SLZ0_9EURY|nr:hypothetical protein [Natrinema soli]